MKIVATNKKAFHDYTIEDTYEAGINLIGCEVKSIRLGSVNLKDSYVKVTDDSLSLVGCYIANYDKGSFSNQDSRRERRLLMNSSEIRRISQKVKEKGYTVVPLKIYFNGSLVKVEIALAKGKQTFDKKRSIMEKDLDRAMQRATKDYTTKKFKG
ncbi:MAG TPA: SsrA-binding protein SmpB [Eubacteriales bacterium]|nr:SsrA-binding protein SmpB [Eubacteriales bacterium]